MILKDFTYAIFKHKSIGSLVERVKTIYLTPFFPSSYQNLRFSYYNSRTIAYLFFLEGSLINLINIIDAFSHSAQREYNPISLILVFGVFFPLQKALKLGCYQEPNITKPENILKNTPNSALFSFYIKIRGRGFCVSLGTRRESAQSLSLQNVILF